MDTAPPEVERIVATFGGVEVLFSEPVDSATLPAAVTVDGQSLTWTAAGSEYPLPRRHRPSPRPAPGGGRHPTPRPRRHPTDGLSQLPLLHPGRRRHPRLREARPQRDQRQRRPEPPTASGPPPRPRDRLPYVRNRYFDPEIGRFITADPLGFVDGPSEYAFAGNSPANAGDPLGLYELDFHFYMVYYLRGAYLSLPNVVLGFSPPRARPHVCSEFLQTLQAFHFLTLEGSGTQSPTTPASGAGRGQVRTFGVGSSSSC